MTLRVNVSISLALFLFDTNFNSTFQRLPIRLIKRLVIIHIFGAKIGLRRFESIERVGGTRKSRKMTGIQLSNTNVCTCINLHDCFIEKSLTEMYECLGFLTPEIESTGLDGSSAQI